MTTRTFTYAKPDAGALEIIFFGAYTTSVTVDAGFPATGSADILLECTVSNSGGQLAKTYISRDAPSSHVFLAYPGGNESWTVSVTDMSVSYGGGLGSVGVTPKLSFLLVKK